MMAECYDQDQEDRYRLLHRRLATAYRPAPVPPHPPDDEDESHHPPVAESAAHLFGGSFQFIVQEQAKSMVAIQVKTKTRITHFFFLSRSFWAGCRWPLICFPSRSDGRLEKLRRRHAAKDNETGATAKEKTSGRIDGAEFVVCLCSHL